MSRLKVALEATPDLLPGPRCSVTRTLAAMPEDEAADLQRFLDDPTIGHNRLSAALRQAGYHLAGQTIGRHRNGECVGCRK